MSDVAKILASLCVVRAFVDLFEIDSPGAIEAVTRFAGDHDLSVTSELVETDGRRYSVYRMAIANGSRVTVFGRSAAVQQQAEVTL